MTTHLVSMESNDEGRTYFATTRFHIWTFSTTLERIEVGESTLSFRIVLERLSTFLLNRVSNDDYSNLGLCPTSTGWIDSCAPRQYMDQTLFGGRGSLDSCVVARESVGKFHLRNRN